MKKKLLFINNGLYGGGAERILQTILKNLDKDNYEITLYSVIKEKFGEPYPQHIKYKYIYNQSNPSDSFLYRIYVLICNKIKLLIYKYCSPSLFYRLLIRGTYDTEVAFIEGYATRIISGSTNKYSNKLAWVHIDLLQNHWTKVAFKDLKEENKCYKKFNQILCVSDSVRSSFLKLFKETSNVNVCYNPIDDNKIRFLANQACSYDKWLDSKLSMVTMGRLVEQKGYDRLLSIVKKLKEEGFHFKLNILGEGKDRSLLENYIKEHQLEDTVSLIGYCENPYPYLKKGDLFVCSSRSEGYSTVVTEAMILGIPVITTNCAGMDELLENGKYGLITDNTDEALYFGLKELMNQPTIIANYKELAIQRGAYFTLENRMKRLNEIL